MAPTMITISYVHNTEGKMKFLKKITYRGLLKFIPPSMVKSALLMVAGKVNKY